jgi:hypothetical protein
MILAAIMLIERCAGKGLVSFIVSTPYVIPEAMSLYFAARQSLGNL